MVKDELAGIIGNNVQSTKMIKPQLGLKPDKYTYLRTRIERITLEQIDLQTNKLYIADSFVMGHSVNGIIGYGKILDDFESGSVASWSGGSGVTLSDSANQVRVKSGSMKVVFASTGSKTISTTQSFGDISTQTGVSSGTPSQGIIGVWWYSANTTDITAISLKIGSSASDYIECTGKEYCSNDSYYEGGALSFQLNSGWNYYLFDLDNPDSITGTPDWTACDYAVFTITVAAASTGYMDYFTISRSNYIGANGLGNRIITKDNIIQRRYSWYTTSELGNGTKTQNISISNDEIKLV